MTENPPEWRPVLPPKPRCPKCGAVEGDFHDEFFHMMVDSSRDPLWGMKERVFAPAVSDEFRRHMDLSDPDMAWTFGGPIRWCGFRPALIP